MFCWQTGLVSACVAEGVSVGWAQVLQTGEGLGHAPEDMLVHGVHARGIAERDGDHGPRAGRGDLSVVQVGREVFEPGRHLFL